MQEKDFRKMTPLELKDFVDQSSRDYVDKWKVEERCWNEGGLYRKTAQYIISQRQSVLLNLGSGLLALERECLAEQSNMQCVAIERDHHMVGEAVDRCRDVDVPTVVICSKDTKKVHSVNDALHQKIAKGGVVIIQEDINDSIDKIQNLLEGIDFSTVTHSLAGGFSPTSNFAKQILKNGSVDIPHHLLDYTGEKEVEKLELSIKRLIERVLKQKGKFVLVERLGLDPPFTLADYEEPVFTESLRKIHREVVMDNESVQSILKKTNLNWGSSFKHLSHDQELVVLSAYEK